MGARARAAAAAHARALLGLFDRLDADGSGSLERGEFLGCGGGGGALGLLGLTSVQAVALFEQLDADGSGGVDRAELERAAAGAVESSDPTETADAAAAEGAFCLHSTLA